MSGHDDLELARLEQRLREVNAEIHVEREIQAYRLHRRLRACGIHVVLDTLLPLGRSGLEYHRPRRAVDSARMLVRPSGEILRVQ